MFTGCGDDDDPMMEEDAGAEEDTGTQRDTGTRPRDTGPPARDVCESPRQVTLMDGEQSVMGDTTNMPSDLELSMGCGMGESAREVIEFVVPGEGERGVLMNLAQPGTDAMFDTVLEVRPRACNTPADAQCFDDIAQGNLRSAGAFAAEGGSSIYAIVTGYDASNSGPWEMAVEVSDISAPTITSAFALNLDNTSFFISIEGMDAEGDVTGYDVEFLDGEGMPIDLGMGETSFMGNFDEPVFEMMSFSGVSTLGGIDQIDGLSEAAMARISLRDLFGMNSEALEIPLQMPREVGESCGDMEHCRPGIECAAMMCAIPEATQTACDAATALMAPGAVASTEMFTATIEPGDGAISGSCSPTRGTESLHTVTIPADSTYDLTVTTVAGDNEAMTDTVLYIQSTCGDPATERPMMGDAWCNDDIAQQDLRSTITAMNLGEGTYTIVVEAFSPVEASTTFDVEVTLTPVIAMGMACDPTGEMNRCAGDACPTMGEALCP